MNDFIFISIIMFLVGYIFYNRKGSNKNNPVSGKITVYLVINKSLHMSVGKIVAQIGHALFNVVSTFNKQKELFDNWESNGREIEFYEATIEEIKSLAAVLNKHSIPYSKIVDAGRTQIPSGSNTVLIVGPCKEKEISSLVCHLNRFLK